MFFKSGYPYFKTKCYKLRCFAGRGAWSGWTYELSISNTDGRENFTMMNIADASVFVESLQSNTLYHLCVRGYSSGGSGPWSRSFTTKALDAGWTMCACQLA